MGNQTILKGRLRAQLKRATKKELNGMFEGSLSHNAMLGHLIFNFYFIYLILFYGSFVCVCVLVYSFVL